MTVKSNEYHRHFDSPFDYISFICIVMTSAIVFKQLNVMLILYITLYRVSHVTLNTFPGSSFDGAVACYRDGFHVVWGAVYVFYGYPHI